MAVISERFADMHTHTRASDGVDSPARVVELAVQAGLAAIAITDHDTVSGIAEALEQGQRLGIEVIPGVEISTVAFGQDIHVLGYDMDIHDRLFLQRLGELRQVRERRNQLMIDRLRELGMNVTLEEVVRIANKLSPGEESVGRPHIAELLVLKGYTATVQDAFHMYLGKTGSAYVNPPRIRPEEAIDWIHEAGGAAVLAHPGLYHQDELVEELARYGLDGIEAYHSDHSREDEVNYAELADKFGLIVTAGSDYHGERNGQVFHGAIGSRKAPVTVFHQLQARRRS
jgi:3',5'-nucleoside bisphosphate phosphatase